MSCRPLHPLPLSLSPSPGFVKDDAANTMVLREEARNPTVLGEAVQLIEAAEASGKFR